MTRATMTAVRARAVISAPAETGVARRRLRIPDSRWVMTERARLLTAAWIMPSAMMAAVRTVAEGGSYLDLAVTHRVLSAFRTHTSPDLRSPDPSLTPANSRSYSSSDGAWPTARSPDSSTSAR
jgi:hypothetical protein